MDVDKLENKLIAGLLPGRLESLNGVKPKAEGNWSD